MIKVSYSPAPDKRFKVKITRSNVTGDLLVSASDLESAYKLVKTMNFTIVSIVEQETSQPPKVP